MANAGREERLLTPAFALLGVADLCYFTAFGIALYALPLYVAGPLGSDEGGVGLAFGAFAVAALVCRPFAGWVADRHGRIVLLVAGAAVTGIGMLLLSHVDALGAVVAIRLLQGVGEAAFFVAASALLVDIAPPQRLGEALSYNSLGLYLGLALGPPLAEVLVESRGYSAAWYAAGGLAVLAGVLGGSIREPARARSGPAPDGLAGLVHRPAIPVSLAFFSSVAAAAGFLAFASLHAEAVGMEETSVPLLTYGATVVTCRVLFARVPDRVPPLPLGAAALLAIAVGLAVMALWAAPAGLLLGAVVCAGGVSLATPAFFSAVFASARPSERGAASGTVSAFLDLGLGAGPILLGVVARGAGLSAALGVATMVALAGAGWTTLLLRRSARTPPDRATAAEGS